ncbi:hypothetical protein BTS2_1979 [Bacillus sp. TS-2]|nr:hypothetical protein BTS2_1979 [Bacillus sp. TS-2]
MECTKCGKSLSSTDKFCIDCGERVENEQETAATAENIEEIHSAQNEEQVQSNSENKTSNSGGNEKVEQAKKAASDYFTFFKSQIKQPVLVAERNEDRYALFGYISFGVFAFLFALASFFEQRALFDGFLSSFMGDEINFFEVFLTNLIYIFILLVACAGIIFLVLKFVMKIELKFQDSISRFGTWMTVPILIAAAYLFFSIIGISEINTLLTILLLAFIQMAIIFTFFSYRSQMKKLDPIYGLVLVYFGVALFLGLTGDFLVGSMIRMFRF